MELPSDHSHGDARVFRDLGTLSGRELPLELLDFRDERLQDGIAAVRDLRRWLGTRAIPVNRMKRYALLAGLVGAAAIALTIVAGGPRRGATFDLRFWGDRDVRVVACDQGGVWITATTTPDAQQALNEGVASALSARHSTLLHATRDSRVTRIDVGGDPLILGASICGRVTWITIADERRPGERYARIVASSDSGRSWEELHGPAELTGAACAGENAGYAWSRTRISRTGDRGKTWRSIAIESFIVPAGAGSLAPRVSTRGELWVPLRTAAEPGDVTPKRPASALVVVTPDLSTRQVAVWATDSIDIVAPDASLGPLVALSPLSSRGFRIDRIAAVADPARRKEVLREAASAVLALDARRSVVVVQHGTFDASAHVFSKPRQGVAVSRDGGETWRHEDTTSAAADSLCVVEDGFWTASSRDKQIVFNPTAE